MKHAIRVAFLMSAAGVLTGFPNGSPGLTGGVTKLTTSEFTVAIKQDGKLVTLHDNEARLAKGPFTVILVLPRWSGVMVNASHTDRLTSLVKAGSPVSAVLPLPKRAMPEDMGNPRQCVFVSDEGYNYWYYLGDAKSSFDEVTNYPREFVCKRHVANLAPDKDGPLTPLTQSPQADLYLTFVATQWSGGQRVEKASQYVKLVFE